MLDRGSCRFRLWQRIRTKGLRTQAALGQGRCRPTSAKSQRTNSRATTARRDGPEPRRQRRRLEAEPQSRPKPSRRVRAGDGTTSDKDLERVVDSVQNHLAGIQPFQSQFQRAAIFGEAVSLPPSNPRAFQRLRDAVRAGIHDALGSVTELEDGFRAHASLAYSNGDADARTVQNALDGASPTPALAAIHQIALIRMHRDERMYEWETVATASLD